MLNAQEARAIASNSYTYVYDRIEDAAHNNQYSVTFDHYLDKELIQYLESLGYKVTLRQEDIFEETPYGPTDKIISCTFETKVSW